jgi:uncharacterized protein (TIGR04255 family)
MPEKLPTFDAHPLDETVMGVQFEPLKAFGLQHLLLYWLRIRARYPQIDSQAPLPHLVEQPGLKPQEPAVTVEAADKLPPPRCWYLDPSGNELIQVQPDKFLRNWRLRQGNERYPRFQHLFNLFWEEWEGFQAFLRDEKLGQPKINQCELTYVNYIDLDQVDGGLSGLENAFSILCKPKQPGTLPPPELFSWRSVYPLGNGIGRLHVMATPNFRARDFKLVVNFTLTARGVPAEPSDSQVRSWFESAHEWVVRAFAELTTPEMHQIWKRQP